MRRDQLEHAIRAACQITETEAVIIVGSQSILGSYNEDLLPAIVTESVEVDILPITKTNDEANELADLIEGVAGEMSAFSQTHKFYLDGVDLTTSILPEGWRDRLVKVQNINTAAPSGRPQFTGWCLEPHDLCVAKICAMRPKDQNFVRALIEHGFINPNILADRLQTVEPQHKPLADNALTWLDANLRKLGIETETPAPPSQSYPYRFPDDTRQTPDHQPGIS